MHDASLYLLKNSVKDSRFVAESRVFGKELIGDVVQEPLFRRGIKEFVIEQIHKEKVKTESTELLKFVAYADESKSLMGAMLQEVMLRPNMRALEAKVFSDCGFDAVLRPETFAKYGQTVAIAATYPEVV